MKAHALPPARTPAERSGELAGEGSRAQEAREGMVGGLMQGGPRLYPSLTPQSGGAERVLGAPPMPFLTSTQAEGEAGH